MAPWAMACMKSPLISQGYLFNRFKDNWFITAEGGVNYQFSKTDIARIARSLWAYLAATCRSSSGVKPVLLSSAATCTCRIPRHTSPGSTTCGGKQIPSGGSRGRSLCRRTAHIRRKPRRRIGCYDDVAVNIVIRIYPFRFSP